MDWIVIPDLINKILRKPIISDGQNIRVLRVEALQMIIIRFGGGNLTPEQGLKDIVHLVAQKQQSPLLGYLFAAIFQFAPAVLL